jgi:acetyltransferase-like isoleucine patch superfamily enzyme
VSEAAKNLLYKVYGRTNGRLRKFILRTALKMEGGEFYSQTARNILKDYHKVEIGMYTHGGCFAPGNFSPHTKIGRYCSIARDALGFNRDHPVDFKSTHGFFFNSALDFCDEDKIEYTPLSIGHDVWIGAGAKILASVSEIGTGAVIATQAVVTRDVPPYAVVMGYPARVIRYRFSEGVIQELIASRWWEEDIEDLKPHMEEFTRPYEQYCHQHDSDNHPDGQDEHKLRDTSDQDGHVHTSLKDAG